jgi:hypothetical protein
MALADRRHLQNIADAASLAGGGRAALDIEKWNFTTANWNCGEVQFAMNNAEYAAIQRAEANKFTITDTVGAKHNFVEATCNNASKYIDITVEISGTTASNFLQLVFPEALHNELEAVTRIYPGGPLGGNHAIIALNPDQNCGPKTDFGASSFSTVAGASSRTAASMPRAAGLLWSMMVGLFRVSNWMINSVSSILPRNMQPNQLIHQCMPLLPQTATTRVHTTSQMACCLIPCPRDCTASAAG